MRPRGLLVALISVVIVGVSVPAEPGAASSGRLLPPPWFVGSSDWLTVTTGPTDPGSLAPQVWAITADQDVGALVPFDLFGGLRRLSPDGILIWASTGGRGGPDATFARGRLPLRLSAFRVDRMWEGQPSQRVQQRLRWVSVAGWHLDVRVYFGTQHPGRALLQVAQQEIDRLRLPGARS